MASTEPARLNCFRHLPLPLRQASKMKRFGAVRHSRPKIRYINSTCLTQMDRFVLALVAAKIYRGVSTPSVTVRLINRDQRCGKLVCKQSICDQMEFNYVRATSTNWVHCKVTGETNNSEAIISPLIVLFIAGSFLNGHCWSESHFPSRCITLTIYHIHFNLLG